MASTIDNWRKKNDVLDSWNGREVPYLYFYRRRILNFRIRGARAFLHGPCLCCVRHQDWETMHMNLFRHPTVDPSLRRIVFFSLLRYH